MEDGKLSFLPDTGPVSGPYVLKRVRLPLVGTTDGLPAQGTADGLNSAPALRVGNPTAIPLTRRDAKHFEQRDIDRFARMSKAWAGGTSGPTSRRSGRTRTQRGRPYRRTYQRRTYKRKWVPYATYMRRKRGQRGRYRRYRRY